jgi:hypothetical protein
MYACKAAVTQLNPELQLNPGHKLWLWRYILYIDLTTNARLGYVAAHGLVGSACCSSVLEQLLKHTASALLPALELCTAVRSSVNLSACSLVFAV